MTITYVQASNPIWYIVGRDGLAAGGAQLFTYDNLTRKPKVAYQDAGGTQEESNPIIFDLNGTHAPIYWKQDSADPDDSYFIQVYDFNDNLLWEAASFPQQSGGGGSNVTTYIPIVNYITNNQFINNAGDLIGPLPANFPICPSNHKGFTPAIVPIIGTYGVLAPDIWFTKNNTNATDSLTFPLFDLSDAPLTGDNTPVRYVRYQCTNSPSGEVYKCFQFPITQKVKNLSGAQMTFGVWAAVTAAPITIQVYCRQYYGSGTGATPESASTRTEVGAPLSLTTDWQWFPISFPIPSVAGNSLGTLGLQTDDDALYIQIGMPLGVPCDILFTKPALFLGKVDPNIEFDSYDMIDSVDQTPRTGDVRTSYLQSPQGGWLPMNDGTIGNVSSGATTRAATDTFQLYKILWDAIDNAWAPVSGAPTRGASALADFLANRTIKLPRSLGRALAGAGAGSGVFARSLGEYGGEDTHVMTLLEMPTHNHPGSTVTTGSTGGATSVLSKSLLSSIAESPLVTVASQGSSQPFNIIQNTSWLNVFIKL